LICKLQTAIRLGFCQGLALVFCVELRTGGQDFRIFFVGVLYSTHVAIEHSPSFELDGIERFSLLSGQKPFPSVRNGIALM
jgi:hypothetical protein